MKKKKSLRSKKNNKFSKLTGYFLFVFPSLALAGNCVTNTISSVLKAAADVPPT